MFSPWAIRPGLTFWGCTQRGALTREFYRQQSFEYHYGRLLPAATENYSHSVVWSAR